MATRRAPRASITKDSSFYASLSPPLWKDQLRQRCMERLKQNRHELLAKLRSPDANIADEMKRLVYSEEQRQGRRGRGESSRSGCKRRSARRPVFSDIQTDENGIEDPALVSIDDLMASGQLSEQDYLDIVHSLEDELRNDWDADDEAERFAEEMVEFEEASLAALLAGMDLDDLPVYGEDAAVEDVAVDDDDGDACSAHVLCPICKTGSLRESQSGHHTVGCSCGFSLRIKNILHGALEDLQQKIGDAFMDHREHCVIDPIFAVVTDLDGENEVTDSLLMYCNACGHECLVR